MNATVLAVFSGTDVDQELFERALDAARAEDARLVLLDVRHRQQADRLAEYLEAGSPLGRATVKALQRSVKQQRDRAIEEALRAFAERGQNYDVDVTVREEKGDFKEVVGRVAKELGATTILLSPKAPPVALGNEVRVIHV